MHYINSKHAKYATANPVSKYLVDNFYKNIGALYSNIQNIDNYIEVGCGEGFVTKFLFSIKKPKCSFAIDINPAEVNDAKQNNPQCKVFEASIYQIPFKEDFFDLVVCCEVLEHLEKPLNGIKELHRVSRKYALLSVPHEPVWRILNMARLKYVNRLGNTPGHINHWTISGFKKFIKPYFRIVETRKPLPWTVLFCEKRI